MEKNYSNWSNSLVFGPCPQTKKLIFWSSSYYEDSSIELILTSGFLLGRSSIYIFNSRSQEFIRVGYYVSNEYQDPELQETPPEQPLFEKLTRNILVRSSQTVLSCSQNVASFAARLSEFQSSSHLLTKNSRFFWLAVPFYNLS